MINIRIKQNDDPGFISIVESSLNNITNNLNPDDIYIVCIDHSFDHKWLAYSGKLGGFIPVWNKRITVPAFNPNRVLKIQHIRYPNSKTSVKESSRNKPLHQFYPAMGNIRYYIDELTNAGVFCWYSGNTINNTSGSLMVYTVVNNSIDYWYASFVLDNKWKCNKTKNIGREQLEKMVGLR